MLSYARSRNFPIHLLAFWWMLWLVVSNSDISEFTPPSWETLAQYGLFVLFFVAGHAAVKHRHALGFAGANRKARPFRADSNRMKWALRGSALVCAAMLLYSLSLSGALSSDFVEYFAKLRLEEDSMDSLTGIRALDVLTKILAFPLSYTIVLIVLADHVRHFRWTLALCVFNLVAYSYLWQVNYPLIHLTWFLVFHLLMQAHRRGEFEKRTITVVLILFSTLLASAANRFGGDVLGGLQRYVVGYHLVGFSFYDYQYHDPNSILHIYSYGRSSLGFLDQMLEAVSKMAGADYKAASFENSTYNNEAVDIGRSEFRAFNAFGTLLFSLYRDFHMVGILVGGFAYGALTTHALYQSARNWVCGAFFIMLASSWMMGMMVNPLEQAYFWFAVVVLGAFSLVNRGIRF